jgi:receptor protein-tyrosine kinase
MELLTWENRLSVVAESFRATMASILFSSLNGSGPRVVVLTSPCIGDGKSSIISNLGVALAEIGRRVLLVDFDMRNPQLHRIFNMANSWGLSDLLQEAPPPANLPLEAFAKETKISNLYLLPSGPKPENLAKVLFSSEAAELFKRFRSEFDVVLVDTPPVVQIPDARIVGQFADAAILVVRSGKSRREDAVAALRHLDEASIGVLGLILNDWDPRPTGSVSGYYKYPYTRA